MYICENLYTLYFNFKDQSVYVCTYLSIYLINFLSIYLWNWLWQGLLKLNFPDQIVWILKDKFSLSSGLFILVWHNSALASGQNYHWCSKCEIIFGTLSKCFIGGTNNIGMCFIFSIILFFLLIYTAVPLFMSLYIMIT